MIEIRDERQLKALTGLPVSKLEYLEEIFRQVYQEEQQKAYEKGQAEGTRKRKPGGGRKGKLPTMRDKLVFILYYLKVYPTYDVMGSHFGMDRSRAHDNVHKLAPILLKTLDSLGVLPKRKFESVEEFRATCEGVDKLLIDVTERLHRRSQNEEQQRELYSGKKRDTLSRIRLSPM